MKQTSDLFKIPNVLFAGGGAFRLAVAVWSRTVLQGDVSVCMYPCWVRVPSQVSCS